VPVRAGLYRAPAVLLLRARYVGLWAVWAPRSWLWCSLCCVLLVVAVG
jgi:hypothetical protein